MPGMTQAQQDEYNRFLQGNPGDEGRASEALGFDTRGGSASNPSSGEDLNQGSRDDPTYNPRDVITGRDQGSWEAALRAEARRLGVEYDSTMLDDVVRQVSYAQNAGKDPAIFLQNAFRTIAQRAGNTPGGAPSGGGGGTSGGGSTGGGNASTSAYATGAGGFPTFAPPSPLQLPNPYSYPDYVAPDPFAYDAYTLAQPFAYDPYTPATPFAYDPYTAATPFEYGDFQAPTGQSILSDPSYQFRLEQGQKALDASAANRGTLRTGGHLKDTIGYGQNFASQEYGNIYNRAAEQYGMNRNNAQQNYAMNEANRAGAYNTNLGLAKSSYDTNEANRAGAYNTNLGLAKSTYDTNEGNRAGTYGTNYNVAKDIYGINAAGKANAYGTNRQNAQDTYQSQYKTAEDLYGSQYQTAQDLYNAQQRTAELQFGREWDAYKYANDQKFNYWNAQLGADTTRYGYDTRGGIV